MNEILKYRLIVNSVQLLLLPLHGKVFSKNTSLVLFSNTRLYITIERRLYLHLYILLPYIREPRTSTYIILTNIDVLYSLRI